MTRDIDDGAIVAADAHPEGRADRGGDAVWEQGVIAEELATAVPALTALAWPAQA